MKGSMGIHQSSLSCERFSLSFKNCFGFGSTTASYQPEKQSSSSENVSSEENILPATSSNRTSRSVRRSSKKSNFSKEACCCTGSEVDKDDFAYNICSQSNDSQLSKDCYPKGSSGCHKTQCADCKTNSNEVCQCSLNTDNDRSIESRTSTLSEVAETTDLLKSTAAVISGNGSGVVTTVVNATELPNSCSPTENTDIKTDDKQVVDLKRNSQTELTPINETTLFDPTVEITAEAKNNQLRKSKDIQTPDLTTPANNVVDAEHFRVIVLKETSKLNNLIDSWNRILDDRDSQCPTEVCGDIRTVIGQTRLVIAERFTQFSELVDKASVTDESSGDGQPVLLSDLQGFWDMIYFQVEDVNAKFKSLSELRTNEWKSDASINNKKAHTDSVGPKQPVKRPANKQAAKKKKSQVSAEDKKRREAARKRLAEARKALAQRNQVEQDASSSSAPESVCNKMTFITDNDATKLTSSDSGSPESNLSSRTEPIVDAISCSVAVGQASPDVSPLPTISPSLVH